MQMYRGLDVITNKHPVAERFGVPHHLMDFLDPEDAWRVGQWTSVALETIEDIRRRGKLPIVVGGSHYYVQALLFRESIQDANDKINSGDYDNHRDEMSAKFPILDASTSEILEELKKIDPVMANRWHPNDRRKIQRSLEICLSTNRKASEIYAEVAIENIDKSTARFSNLLFWVHATDEVLTERLRGRVDKMIEQGLFEEIDQLYNLYRTRKDDMDTSSGIWQSIGWKEFLPYLTAKDEFLASRVRDSTEKSDIEDNLSLLKQQGIEKTNVSTRHYFKSQLKWIRVKLLNKILADKGELPEGGMYLLNTSDLSEWDETVSHPAIKLAKGASMKSVVSTRMHTLTSSRAE